MLQHSMNYVRNYFNMDFSDNEKDIRELLLEKDIEKNSEGSSKYVSPISIFMMKTKNYYMRISE